MDKTKYLNSLRAIKAEYVLVSMLTLSIYLTLIIFRALDDNSLTSWHWVFTRINSNKIFLILIIGIVIAYVLSRISFLERYPVPFLFLASFAVAALCWGTPEVIVDASRYFTQAKYLEIYGIGYFFREWGYNIVAWTDLPLIPFLYGLIFKLLGESRIYIQIFITFLFSSTVVLTYWIGKALWDENVGFFGGLLLLGIPYIFTQVPLMLVDVPTMFFFTLAVFAFIKVLEDGGAWIIVLSAIAIFLAFFSKYSTWPMLSVLTVISLVYFHAAGRQEGEFSKKSRLFKLVQQRRVFYRSIAVFLTSVLLIGIVVFLKFGIISEQIKLLISYQQPGLKRWGESFYSTFFFQIHPFLTVAAAYSAYAAFKKKDLRYLIISWLVLLVFLLWIERIRYIIMLFPMLALMASYGLQEIKSKDLRKFIALCAVISSFVIAVFAYLSFLQSISAVNLKNAGEYLDSTGAKNIEVFTLPLEGSVGVNPAVSVPLLDIFAAQNVTYHYSYPLPPWEKIKTSPLRFTWEYKNPQYYDFKNSNFKGNTVVVISGFPDEILPDGIAKRLDGYRLSKVFKISAGIFRYRTIVMVYQPTHIHDSFYVP